MSVFALHAQKPVQFGTLVACKFCGGSSEFI